MQPWELKDLFETVDTELQGNLGLIHYAGTCHIRKHDGVHLVMQGEIGPVTVLFMPGEEITRSSDITNGRFRGVIVPTPNGSMAILGEEGEPIQRIEEQLKSSVSWNG